MTNDGFLGPQSIDLFKIDKPTVFDLYAYDAGTEQNTEKKEDLPALGGLGRPEEKLPIHRHPGIRGDADAPADWGWDVEKPVCADDSYAEVTSLRKAPTVSDRAKGQATITFCLRILDCCRS